MLDIRALSAQLDAMAKHLAGSADETYGRLDAALNLVEQGAGSPDRLLDKVAEYYAMDENPWLLAQPLEPLGEIVPLPEMQPPYSVVATDGSQITPSHHEIALCYLLNVGRILYTYGTGEMPVQDSQPFLYHRDEDMHPLIGRKKMTINEELIATFRNIKEREALSEMAKMAVERGHPTVALVDGSLIQWMLENTPEDFQKLILDGHLAALEELREMGVPVAGYISNSRSADVVNLLKLVACPKAKLECGPCSQDEPPCEAKHIPLSDRRIWDKRLSAGERSPIFRSSAKILNQYGPHHIAFFYLHVGAEVARIEIPAWVAETPEYLARIHALAYDQAQKGMGYPISLQEAHNKAVVAREDRAQFFSLLSTRLARAGVRVAVSNKQLKKRVGVV
jgi:hypothetical protein